MKIVIVGPGAMGCLFGHFLARAGHELILLDHRPERARLLQEQGLLVETAAGTLRTPVQVAARPQDAGIAELCIVAVKAYATRAAAESSLPVVGPDTQVLSLQNGLGNVEALAEVIALLRTSGPKAMSQCKTLIHEVANKLTLMEAYEYTARMIAEIRASDEGQEGMNAFLEKRKPNWVK